MYIHTYSFHFPYGQGGKKGGLKHSPPSFLPLSLTKDNLSQIVKCYKMEVIKTRTEFFMPMIPPTVTHQEKAVHVVKGKPVFYEPDELQAARVKLRDHLAGHVPKEKYTGAVRLLTKWCFPISGRHKDGEYKTTKPDTDNLQKLLKDVMTSLGYWKDDALVASEVAEKFWASLPGIYIVIEELT